MFSWQNVTGSAVISAAAATKTGNIIFLAFLPVFKRLKVPRLPLVADCHAALYLVNPIKIALQNQYI